MNSTTTLVIGGAVVLVAIVLISQRRETLAPTNFSGNPQFQQPERSTWQDVIAGIGSAAGGFASGYRADSSRRNAEERLMNEQSADKRRLIEGQTNRSGT